MGDDLVSCFPPPGWFQSNDQATVLTSEPLYTWREGADTLSIDLSENVCVYVLEVPSVDQVFLQMSLPQQQPSPPSLSSQDFVLKEKFRKLSWPILFFHLPSCHIAPSQQRLFCWYTSYRFWHKSKALEKTGKLTSNSIDLILNLEDYLAIVYFY